MIGYALLITRYAIYDITDIYTSIHEQRIGKDIADTTLPDQSLTLLDSLSKELLFSVAISYSRILSTRQYCLWRSVGRCSYLSQTRKITPARKMSRLADTLARENVSTRDEPMRRKSMRRTSVRAANVRRTSCRRMQFRRPVRRNWRCHKACSCLALKLDPRSRHLNLLVKF